MSIIVFIQKVVGIEMNERFYQKADGKSPKIWEEKESETGGNYISLLFGRRVSNWRWRIITFTFSILFPTNIFRKVIWHILESREKVNREMDLNFVLWSGCLY